MISNQLDAINFFRLANEEWIAYYIKEYSPLLDSANMTYDNYIQIALDIKVSRKFLRKKTTSQKFFFIFFSLGSL